MYNSDRGTAGSIEKNQISLIEISTCMYSINIT